MQIGRRLQTVTNAICSLLHFRPSPHLLPTYRMHCFYSYILIQHCTLEPVLAQLPKSKTKISAHKRQDTNTSVYPSRETYMFISDAKQMYPRLAHISPLFRFISIISKHYLNSISIQCIRYHIALSCKDIDVIA